jgi:hypothetical protein
VDIAALVRHVADLVGAALAATGTAARLILDRGGGAAARLCRGLVVRNGRWERGMANGVDRLAAVNASVGLRDVACVEEAGHAYAVLWNG